MTAEKKAKAKGSNRQVSRAHTPLQLNDTEKQTVGCRHTNPDICVKNSPTKVCAFVRSDVICPSSPRLWSKQYKRLTAE